MDDTETAEIELDRGDAREVINALSGYQSEVSGRDERRALNVREFLQREFGFEEQHIEEDRSLLETYANIFDDDEGPHDVELSRVEAAEVDRALADLEADSEPEAETIADLRDRLAATFDLDTDRAT